MEYVKVNPELIKRSSNVGMVSKPERSRSSLVYWHEVNDICNSAVATHIDKPFNFGAKVNVKVTYEDVNGGRITIMVCRSTTT